MSFLIKLISSLIWLPFVLLWLISWPFFLVYGFFLSAIATYALIRKGRDIVIVQNGGSDPVESLRRLQDLNLSKDRVLILEYADHKIWSWWSLPARLFWAFGPIPIPARFTADYLPAVLLLRSFRRPKTFSFGRLSKDRDSKFDELVAALKLG